ncbi:protein takeout [Helicoverpa armigera]|uniref:protein takeout n=1 Tax=Helicoverpa armigera TaxID=29058 RepID=UPI0030836C8B
MLALQLLVIFATFCLFGSVKCEKKICDFADSKCLTETSAPLFDEFVVGMPGVPPSDPLHLDSFEINQPSIKYTITDANLSRFKNCAVKTVRINAKDMKYDYHIGCPHLTLQSGYEIKGKIGDKSVEGKGTSITDFYDYHLLFDGDFSSRNGENGTVYLHLVNHNLQIQIKGNVKYDYKNLFDGDQEKSDAFLKFVNENWPIMDKTINQPVINAFMNIYIDNVNAYLNIVPVQRLFSYEA